MRTMIVCSEEFKRDYERERAARGQALDTALEDVLSLLVVDALLPGKYQDRRQQDRRLQDRRLPDDWEGYRRCRVRTDLILLYKKDDNETLFLARLGAQENFLGSAFLVQRISSLKKEARDDREERLQ